MNLGVIFTVGKIWIEGKKTWLNLLSKSLGSYCIPNSVGYHLSSKTAFLLEDQAGPIAGVNYMAHSWHLQHGSRKDQVCTQIMPYWKVGPEITGCLLRESNAVNVNHCSHWGKIIENGSRFHHCSISQSKIPNDNLTNHFIITSSFSPYYLSRPWDRPKISCDKGWDIH